MPTSPALRDQLSKVLHWTPSILNQGFRMGRDRLTSESCCSPDHAAYHVGELVVVRRLLGVWPPPSINSH
jgi:hypothetical protein